MKIDIETILSNVISAAIIGMLAVMAAMVWKGAVQDMALQKTTNEVVMEQLVEISEKVDALEETISEQAPTPPPPKIVEEYQDILPIEPELPIKQAPNVKLYEMQEMIQQRVLKH